MQKIARVGSSRGVLVDSAEDKHLVLHELPFCKEIQFDPQPLILSFSPFVIVVSIQSNRLSRSSVVIDKKDHRFLPLCNSII
jgi:hypothetical protein